MLIKIDEGHYVASDVIEVVRCVIGREGDYYVYIGVKGTEEGLTQSYKIKGYDMDDCMKIADTIVAQVNK